MPEILNKIKSPEDVKSLNIMEKEILCNEIRSEIINTVSKNGGHLASNLGVVELSVALFSVFNLPKDTIVWDVGHQCYTHKLLTGRQNMFDKLRKEGGITGFPDREESEFDPFTTGHSSCSISSAFGVCRANELNGDDDYSVAVIGDGALSGGLAFEGFNNAGRNKNNFIVILNDNEMSISKNVGSLAKHLNMMRVKGGYIKTKKNVNKTLIKIPVLGKFFANTFSRSKRAIKRFFHAQSIFESMGFAYYGPYDGHDINVMTKVFESVKKLKVPVLIHVKTTKGKGYEYAEENPRDFHGVAKFNSNLGVLPQNANNFSEVFGETINEFAKNNDKICAITAAMTGGTGLVKFSKNYKQRFFDVGIAEAHAVTFSAGMARKGLIPVFAVYSTFLQRAYDSIMHDVALQRLKVIFAIDRAGFVGDDGKTHQGLFDVSYLKSVPEITVYSPSFYDELQMNFKQLIDGDYTACAVRYPRGQEPYKPSDFVSSEKDYDVYGDENAEISIVCYGRVFSQAVLARELCQKKIKIIKLNKIIPYDKKAIDEVINSKKVVFLEEAYQGIAKDFVSDLYLKNYKGESQIVDVKNPFTAQSTMDRQMEVCGLLAEQITKII